MSIRVCSQLCHGVFGVDHKELFTGSREKLLGEIITQYNSKVMGTTRIDGDERAAVKFLALASPQLNAILRECYNEFKVRESPVPTILLASKFIHSFPEGAPKESRWFAMLTPNDSKCQLWLRRLLRAFRVRVNAAKREGKKANLASRAVPCQQRERHDSVGHVLGSSSRHAIAPPGCVPRDQPPGGVPGVDVLGILAGRIAPGASKAEGGRVERDVLPGLP